MICSNINEFVTIVFRIARPKSNWSRVNNRRKGRRYVRRGLRRGNEAIRVTVKRDDDERTDEESGRRGAALRLKTLESNERRE